MRSNTIHLFSLVVLLSNTLLAQFNGTDYTPDSLMAAFENPDGARPSKGAVVRVTGIPETVEKKLVFKATNGDRVICALANVGGTPSVSTQVTVTGVIRGRGLRGNITLDECQVLELSPSSRSQDMPAQHSAMLPLKPEVEAGQPAAPDPLKPEVEAGQPAAPDESLSTQSPALAARSSSEPLSPLNSEKVIEKDKRAQRVDQPTSSGRELSDSLRFYLIVGVTLGLPIALGYFWRRRTVAIDAPIDGIPLSPDAIVITHQRSIGQFISMMIFRKEDLIIDRTRDLFIKRNCKGTVKARLKLSQVGEIRSRSRTTSTGSQVGNTYHVTRRRTYTVSLVGASFSPVTIDFSEEEKMDQFVFAISKACGLS